MTSSKTENRIGGNRRPQTFRDCANCGKQFGPLPNLEVKFCSKDCFYAFRKGKPNAKRGKKYPHLQRARIGACVVCGKEFRATKDFKTRKQKFCGRECYEIEWKKNIRPLIDTSNSGTTGEENPSWKGEEAGYHAKHKWIARQKGTPSKCDLCGTTEAKKFEWANIDHKYHRVLEDWMRVCTRCHRNHDKKLL